MGLMVLRVEKRVTGMPIFINMVNTNINVQPLLIMLTAWRSIDKAVC